MAMQSLTLNAIVQTTTIQVISQQRKTNMRKMDSDLVGFDQYASECRPSEYFHRKRQSCRKYGRTSHLLATRLVIIESSITRAIGAIISPSDSKYPSPLTRAK